MINGMTVKELIEILEKMPEDAIVMIKHNLVGREQFVENVELDNNGKVWIKDTD